MQIYSTAAAFLAWRSGSGQCWGDFTRGGDCSGVNFTAVTQMYSNDYAFLAVDSSGTAQCWGLNGYGGNCPLVDSLDGFEIYPSSTVFAAINTVTGAGHCWGQDAYGGNCSVLDFRGVTDVWANARAFLAVDRKARTGQAWGASLQGADVSTIDFQSVLAMPTTTRSATRTETTGTSTTATTTDEPSPASVGRCRSVCPTYKWFRGSSLDRVKQRLCATPWCSGCEECRRRSEVTSELPVCGEVCQQYEGSAANEGWKTMAFLCVEEKANDKHKCYPPWRWPFWCSKCRVVEEGEQSAVSGRSLRGSTYRHKW